jgi:hypothetical protein
LAGFPQRPVRLGRAEVLKVTVHTSPSFWRSAFRVTFQLSTSSRTVWVPIGWQRVLPALCKQLREAFPGKFFEVGV